MSDNLTIFGTDYTGVTGIKTKGTGNGTLTYIRPDGTKSITENGTAIDVASYASVDVAVEGGPDWPVFTATSGGTVTCSKTYAECEALGTGSSALAVTLYSEFIGQAYIFEHGLITYVFFSRGVPSLGLNYYENGTIEPLNQAPSVAQLDVTANGTYTSGTNIVWNEVMVNVPSSTPTLQSKTATPTEQQQTVSPDSGYDGLSSVTVEAIPSTYVGSGVTQRTSSDLTASGATVTVPAGYYSAQASKAVASGTEGTPTATKGSVSNHSVTVTPSVTNSAGYIAGGTHSGTGVTVQASELVSGTYTVDSSGTKDITNYASISVPSGSATAPASITGTAATISTGTNTLTLTKSVSVTPSVTAGYVSSGTAGNSSISLTASVPTKAAATITPSTTNQTIAANTYLTGAQTIAGDADLVASNIISTANIFGVQGSVIVQNYYTGSSTPSSSLGQNGDIYLQE